LDYSDDNLCSDTGSRLCKSCWWLAADGAHT